MNLFKCETVAQFKIGVWLAEQGIEKDGIASAELLARDTVRVINHAGQYLDIRWRDDDCAEIV